MVFQGKTIGSLQVEEEVLLSKIIKSCLPGALPGDGGSPATEDSRLQRALSAGRRLCSDWETRMEMGVQLGRGEGRG